MYIVKVFEFDIVFIQEENSIVHEEFMNNIPRPFFRSVAIMAASMSVSVDLRNQTQVERLRQVLRLWTRKMMGLEIIFKVCIYMYIDSCLFACFKVEEDTSALTTKSKFALMERYLVCCAAGLQRCYYHRRKQ